jgi:hypothetical protein
MGAWLPGLAQHHSMAKEVALTTVLLYTFQLRELPCLDLMT